MTEVGSPSPLPERPQPTIFVSYRRDDSAAIVYHMYDILTARYGAGTVFIDIDDVPGGVDFRDHVNAVLRETDLVLAVVGPDWCGMRETGNSRINDDKDLVRAEIETAFAQKITIIPVLVKGAFMPRAAELPASLQNFVFLNAMRVDTGLDFRHHLNRLIGSMDESLNRNYQLPTWPPRENFWTSLAKVVQRPSIWVLGAALAMPAVLSVTFAPPWPTHPAIVTCVFVGFVLIAAYYLPHGSPRKLMNWMLMFAIAVAVLATCVYLLLFSQLTYVAPTTGERFAKGFVCTSDAKILYADKCPYLGLDELRGAEYSSERLWTNQSVTEVKVGLFVIWIGGWLGLALVAAILAKSLGRVHNI
jgi:hypothetical protein